MTRSPGRSWLPAVLSLFAHAALAATVTVNVRTAAGAPVADAIVVFDPQDAVPAPSHPTAVIDQINKRFVPRVSVVRTGTAVTFPNGDHIRHQVYSFSEAKKFTLKLYAGSPHVDVVFDKPGLVILGCNIHDTMVAFVGVVDSPYFGKSGDSGSFSLELPQGHYKVRVWHANLSDTPPPIAPSVIESTAAPLSIPITVALDTTRETVAAWPE
jgi:plastocyanin